MRRAPKAVFHAPEVTDDRPATTPSEHAPGPPLEKPPIRSAAPSHVPGADPAALAVARRIMRLDPTYTAIEPGEEPGSVLIG